MRVDILYYMDEEMSMKPFDARAALLHLRDDVPRYFTNGNGEQDPEIVISGSGTAAAKITTSWRAGVRGYIGILLDDIRDSQSLQSVPVNDRVGRYLKEEEWLRLMRRNQPLSYVARVYTDDDISRTDLIIDLLTDKTTLRQYDLARKKLKTPNEPIGEVDIETKRNYLAIAEETGKITKEEYRRRLALLPVPSNKPKEIISTTKSPSQEDAIIEPEL